MLKLLRGIGVSVLSAAVLCVAPSALRAQTSPPHATPAAAPPAVRPVVGFVSPYEIIRNVRAAGFDPLVRPLREGTVYVLRATDYRGALMRIVLDARTGTIRDVTPIVPAEPEDIGLGPPLPFAPPPYAPPDYLPPVYAAPGYAEPAYEPPRYAPPPAATSVPVEAPVYAPAPGPAAARRHLPPLPRPRPAALVQQQSALPRPAGVAVPNKTQSKSAPSVDAKTGKEPSTIAPLND